MKRIPIFLILALVLVLGIRLARRSIHTPPAATGFQGAQATGVTAVAVATAVSAGQPALLGETILRDFANPNQSPENDLRLMARLMENSLLLLKSAADRPLSANEDWAGLFRGANAARERFLSDQHPALNSQGRLVDRWGTPLFFHALGGNRHDIRSAGPDRALWTADDIHRNADGSFRRGGDLNPASLLPNAYPASMPVR